MLMVSQRAWTEAEAALKAPDVDDIRGLLQQEDGHKELVAQHLGIALSTVYKVLRRGKKPRLRQYLRPQALAGRSGAS